MDTFSKKYWMVPAGLLNWRYWNHIIFSVNGNRLARVAYYDTGIINGILTSIILETFILSKQMELRQAFKTAVGMSLISMVSMEMAMNITDVLLTGGAVIKLWVLPFMLFAGFITPLPYNYWRLKALGKSCH